jgi:peptide/nickel transport system permease protein
MDARSRELHSARAQPEAQGLPAAPAQRASRDYWDLVWQQLARRRSFRAALWILVLLYGLAIFAPLLASDRPYRLVAIDRGRHEQARSGLGQLGRAALEALEASAARGPGAAAGPGVDPQARLTGLAVRVRELSEHAPQAYDRRLAALYERFAAAFAAPPAAEGLRELRAELEALVRELAPAASPAPAQEPAAGAPAGLELEPYRRYPILEILSPTSLFLMGLWLAGASFPLWNRLWNLALGADPPRRRRARPWKALALLLPGAVLALGFVALAPGRASPFDSAPYKRGLSSGALVAVERPLFPPLATGYAELHPEESFRPPTFLSSSWVDDQGRALDPARRPRADGIGGFELPSTPVEVRFGEPPANAPHRHLLGTDELGRDLLVRLLWGARVSLSVGILSALLLTAVGVLLGALAGYLGGWVDLLVMRGVEILQSIPAFFLILAALSFTDQAQVPPMVAIVGVMALVRWTSVARLVRGEFLRLEQQEFVLAARALGFSGPRIALLHILPNALAPVLVSAAFSVATGILTESAISFLGLGVQHPEASWGSLINESKSPEHWWVQVFPGLLIFLTVTCYNLVGDAVRDALDPKARRW